LPNFIPKFKYNYCVKYLLLAETPSCPDLSDL
jgi:hypothetical protein